MVFPSSFLLYQKAAFIYSENTHLKKSAENFQDEHACVLVECNKTCVSQQVTHILFHVAMQEVEEF